MNIFVELLERLNPAFIMISGMIIGGILATIFNYIWLVPIGFGIAIIITLIGLYFTYYKGQQYNLKVEDK